MGKVNFGQLSNIKKDLYKWIRNCLQRQCAIFNVTLRHYLYGFFNILIFFAFYKLAIWQEW